MKDVGQRHADREWKTVTMDEELRRLGYRTNRANIGVTFRRLVQDGVFQIAKASRRGNIYKWAGSKPAK